MSFFTAEAIIMSSISKFGKRCPCTDREDVRSSSALTISTSLINDIASESEPEQAQTSVLNLTFQKRGNGRRRELVEVQIRDLGSLVVNHAILRIDSFCVEGRIPN